MAAGTDDFVPKPVEPATPDPEAGRCAGLILAIEGVMGGRRALDGPGTTRPVANQCSAQP